MREMVSAGSTMTRSPVFRVLTYVRVSLYCSAIRGDMFDLVLLIPQPEGPFGREAYLNPPAPHPKMTRPTEKHPKAPDGWAMTGGSAEIIRITWPRSAKPMESWIVLSRPRNSSAIQAPRIGVT